MAESSENKGETEIFEILSSQQTLDTGSEQGRRLTCLKNILSRCTERCFASARLEKLTACFPDIRGKDPETFDSIVQQLINGLKCNVQQELELMIQQENLVSLCHELDKLTAEAQDNSEAAWRPTGKPNEDIKDHIIITKVELRDKLKEKLKQLQDENKVTQENIMTIKTEIKNTEENILKQHENLQKVAKACDSLEETNNNTGRGNLEKMIIDLQR